MDSKHKTTTEQGQDAIELLVADHHLVAKLFAEFNALKEVGSDEAKSTLVEQICRELTVHTAIEEEIFYPAVRKAIEDDDLMDEALVEHAGAKELIAQLRAANPDDDLYDAKVTVLAEQIDHHVQEEEGSMFPQAKGSGMDTMALGAALLKRKAELLGNSNASPPITMGGKAEHLAGHDLGDHSNYPQAVKPRRSSALQKRGRRSEAKKRASKTKKSIKTR